MPKLSGQTALVTFVAVAMVVSACVPSPTATTTLGPDLDLSDPDTLAALGISAPSIDWERSIDRLVYAGAGSPPSPEELTLVTQVIDDLPTAFLDKLDLRYVIRSGDKTATRADHPTAVAFALGPDIYLLDRTFNLSEGGSTRFDLARAVVHELVHVAQFQEMTHEYARAALDGVVTRLNPIDGSTLVAEFASATGWDNNSTDVVSPRWNLSPGETASSSYGATNPGEDMAEAVSLVILGLADLVPDDRVRWVEQWLGAPADALALGQPWAPAGSIELITDDALYDEETVAAMQGPLGHTEALYFKLPSDVPETNDLASLVESRPPNESDGGFSGDDRKRRSATLRRAFQSPRRHLLVGGGLGLS